MKGHSFIEINKKKKMLQGEKLALWEEAYIALEKMTKSIATTYRSGQRNEIVSSIAQATSYDFKKKLDDEERSRLLHSTPPVKQDIPGLSEKKRIELGT